ncbi:hypothetical protein [Sphingopyxis solisilvae]|uniref:hypothetical protein n=1 Tax=Sphingopyxis solisilvae TaxID=1886788 RepID=UPI0018929869|nr:hypothetical protein [Sphingopyxis solisilvae]
MDMVQWIGIWAFGLASVASLAAGTRPWPLLGLANAGFAIEAAFGWRHDLPAVIARSIGEFSVPFNMLHLAIILFLAAAGLLVVARANRAAETGSSSGAATATLLSALLFLVDTASLGGIDDLLSREAHGLPVLGWLWALLGGITILAALFGVRRSGAKTQ